MSRVITTVFGLLLAAASAGCGDSPVQDAPSGAQMTSTGQDTPAGDGTAQPDANPPAATSWEMTPIELPAPREAPPGAAPDATAAAPTAAATDANPATPRMNEIEPAAGPPAAVPKAIPEPAVGEPEGPDIDGNPERLVGVGTAELTRMLGDPRFVRRDSDAQLWRYRNDSCILDLFLYRKAGQQEFQVSHFETRHREGGAVPTYECFEKLLLERRDDRSS